MPCTCRPYVHTTCAVGSWTVNEETGDITAMKLENDELRRQLEQAERALAGRVRQQRALSNLGMAAIRERDLQALFQRASETLGETLDVELCKVLELLPDGAHFLLRAGIGWREGVIGQVQLGTGRDSQSGYTLVTDEPVIVEDLHTERRFRGPQIVLEHGGRSGMSCIIGGTARPWGVLTAITTSLRQFTHDDIAFLQSVANVLAAAIQRRNAEEKLQASEAKHRAMFTALVEGVVFVDLQGRIEEANDRVDLNHHGHSRTFPGLAHGQPCRLVRPDGTALPQQDQPVLVALRTAAPVRNVEVGIQHEDGTMTWRLVNASPVRDDRGELMGAVASFFDITDRKQAEQALRQSESFYRQTLESVPGMTFTNTPAGACDYVSEQWVEFTGISAADQLGEGWMQVVHPEDRGHAAAAWRAAVEERGDYDLEYRVRRHDGEYEWFKVRGRPIRDEAGRIARWLGMAVNINSLKNAEQSLKEADRRKDEFLAMLAHELRNPLAPIVNAMQIFRHLKTHDPRLERAGAMVDRQVNHLIRLVDDLLDVSRVSRGKISLERAPVDLAAVVQLAVETTKPMLDSRHHQLKITLPEKPIHVLGDLTRLAQVVGNLLNNAAKYTDDGGKIMLEVKQGTTKTDREASIHVLDNGRGIDPHAQNNLFQLFYQVDRNLDRSEGGLGIGLSLVKSLVEMHGGRVEAFSAGRGMGSEFVVHLPQLTDDVPGQTANDADDGLPISKQSCMLVVDDNRDSADTMAMLLELEGHRALVAYDGRQAVEVALAERPAVVLLDIGLPHLNGYDACRAMRSGGLRDTLIVAMTGYGQDDDRKKSEQAGFDAHLVKPVELSAIRELLAARTPKMVSHEN